MRSKGSPEFLKIGLEFANTVTVETGENCISCKAVDCKGPNSIFAALSVIIPTLVRKNNLEKTLRGSFSDTEFCKYLIRSGYIACRFRSRVKGTKDQWTKGVRRWKNRRWADPNNPEDMLHLRATLREFQARYSASWSIPETKILEFISALSNTDSLGSRSPFVFELAPWTRAGQMIPRSCFRVHRRYVFLETEQTL